MSQSTLRRIAAIALLVATLLASVPPMRAHAQEAPALPGLPAGTQKLYVPLLGINWYTGEPLVCGAGWEKRYTPVPIDTYQLAQETATPERYISFHNPTAGGGIVPAGDYCKPSDPKVSWYEGYSREAEWAGARSTYAGAALLAVADGPLPAGDFVAVGLLLAAGGSTVLATLYQANSVAVVPTFVGWKEAGSAPLVRKVESWALTQVTYFEPPDILWGRETVWVIPARPDYVVDLGAVIDSPTEDLYIYTQPKAGTVQTGEFGSLLVEASNRPNIKGTVPLSEAQRRQVAQKQWTVRNPDGSIVTGGFDPSLIRPKVQGAYEPPDHVAQHGDEVVAGDGKEVSFAKTASYRFNEWIQAQARQGVTTGPQPECFEGKDRNGNKVTAVFVKAAVQVWDGVQWLLVGSGSWNIYYATARPRSTSFWTKAGTADTGALAGASGWTHIPCDGPYNPGGIGLIPTAAAEMEMIGQVPSR